jgi:hypothetical protein
MAFNDTTLKIVGELDPTKRARFSTTLITPGATRVVTFPDADITLGGTYVHPNHSGDVTSVADGATTIANDAVTYAKMQNAGASSRLVGSGTSGAGANLEELTLGTNLSMSGTTLNAAAGAAGTTGTAILDFGAHPGKSHASVVITGQASIVSGSIVQAWLRPVVTADHTADEHLVAPIRIVAANIVAGTGFTIHGFNTASHGEPIVPPHSGATFYMITVSTILRRLINAGRVLDFGGKVSRPHGQWTVAWRWS